MLHNNAPSRLTGFLKSTFRRSWVSRSLKDVLALMEKIAQAKAGFRSLTEAIDSLTSIHQ